MSATNHAGPIKALDQGGFAKTVPVGSAPKPFDQGGFAIPLDQGGFAVGPGGPALLSIGVLADPASPTQRFPLVSGGHFPRRAWDPTLYAQAVLAEFASSGWIDALSLPSPPLDPADLAAEIVTLIELAEQRVPRAAEIVAQAQDASVYWAALLMLTPASHPATWDLMIVANTVGHMVAMHFKRQFMRARPAQVYPALMPMLPTPGHPSYPNAHALENALIAACLELALPALGAKGEAQGPLDVLALRIGQNREIAGLHFPSDTAAGRSLAPGIMRFLEPGPLFREIVDLARLEWESLTVTPFASA